MELGTTESSRRHHPHRRPSSLSSASDVDVDIPDIKEQFELAAKWDSVLLIDECDTYLTERSKDEPGRNRIVNGTFLQLSHMFLSTPNDLGYRVPPNSRILPLTSVPYYQSAAIS